MSAPATNDPQQALRRQREPGQPRVDDPLGVVDHAVAESEDGGDLLDQTAALELFGRGLVYHTAPLAQDTEVSGFPRASLWLALDVPAFGVG